MRTKMPFPLVLCSQLRLKKAVFSAFFQCFALRADNLLFSSKRLTPLYRRFIMLLLWHLPRFSGFGSQTATFVYAVILFDAERRRSYVGRFMPCGLILSPIWSRAESSCLRTEMRGYAHQHYSRKYAGILFMLSVFLSDQQSADSYACTPGAPAYCCRRCQRADRHSTDDGLPVHTCWLRFGRSFYISLDRLHRNGAAFQIQDHLA